RSTVKKSDARIASAWERRNCAQAGPVRRGAGPVPLAWRISHTADAATLTPKAGQLPVDPPVAPLGVLPGQPGDQGPNIRAAARPAGPAAHGPRRPAAPDDISVPAHDGVRGDQQPQPVPSRPDLCRPGLRGRWRVLVMLPGGARCQVAGAGVRPLRAPGVRVARPLVSRAASSWPAPVTWQNGA